MKNTLEPLETDLGVSISRFGNRIVPSGGGERGPVASMRASWPNNHRFEIPTIGTDAFDCSHRCSFDTRTSVVSPVILRYESELIRNLGY